MSTRTALLALALVAAVGALVPNVAWAQAGAGGLYSGRSDNPVGPTVSPYLNLLQNNNQLNPVTSYQSLVRPLVDQGDAIRRQGNSINQLQQRVNANTSALSAPGRGTGHTTFFMNYSHYYSMPSAGR
jgi:hypothetical protein